MHNQRITLKIWLAWLTVTFLYAYQYILRIAPSVMMSQIADKYHVSALDLGHFAGIYYIGYAVMHLPFGALYDRFNVRLILCVSIIMIIVGQSPLLYSNSWSMVLIGRFLFGAGSSGAILAVFKVIRGSFPTYLFPRLLSFSVTIGLIGALAGGYPIQEMLIHYSWQTVQLWLMGMGVILMIVNLFLTPDNHIPIVEKTSSKKLLHKSLLIPILFTAGIGGLMVGPMEGFADFWGPNFLKTVYHLSTPLSAFLPSLIFIGMAVGAPLMGFWIEKSARYDLILKICAGVMATLFIALIYFKMPQLSLYVLFFIIGMMCSYQILIIHINNLRVDNQYAGIVSATSNMVIMVSGSFFHYFIGFMMDHINQYNLMTLSTKQSYSYQISLGIIPLSLIAALVFLNRKKYFLVK